MSVACGRDSESPAPSTSHHAVLHVVAALSCTSVYLWLHYRKLLSRFFASQLPFRWRPSNAFKPPTLALALAIYLTGRRINCKRGHAACCCFGCFDCGNIRCHPIKSNSAAKSAITECQWRMPLSRQIRCWASAAFWQRLSCAGNAQSMQLKVSLGKRKPCQAETKAH